MHPVLFKLGPLTVHSYGVFLMIGFAAAVLWSIREGARRGIAKDDIVDTGLALLVGGLIGARALFILLNRGSFSSPAQWLHIWEGGLSFHGCLVGGAIAMFLIARRRGIPLIPLMDTAAPAVPLGYFFGRIGCYLNGCCYGGVCDLPWATRFHDATAPGGLTPPSHPTQLYSALAGLFMFGFLAWLSRRQRFDGQLALLFFVLYSTYRFIVEFFRKGVSARVAFEGLTQAQVASILIALTALILMAVAASAQKRRARPLNEAAR